MGKKKSREDQYFPIPQGLTLRQSNQLEENPNLTKQIVRQTIQAAYKKRMHGVNFTPGFKPSLINDNGYGGLWKRDFI